MTAEKILDGHLIDVIGIQWFARMVLSGETMMTESEELFLGEGNLFGRIAIAGEREFHVRLPSGNPDIAD